MVDSLHGSALRRWCLAALATAGIAGGREAAAVSALGHGEVGIGIARSDASGDYSGESSGVRASFVAVGQRAGFGLGAELSQFTFTAKANNAGSTGFVRGREVAFQGFATEIFVCHVGYVDVCGGPGHAFLRASEGGYGRAYGTPAGALRVSTEVAPGCGAFAEYQSSLAFLGKVMPAGRQGFAYGAAAAGISYWMTPDD